MNKDYVEIENSTIYVVCVDGESLFYCFTFDEAQEQAVKYLSGFFDDRINYKYHIDCTGNKVILTSTYRWFVFQYDTVESVAVINGISKIKFID